MIKIGIIGGSGLENPDILTNPKEFITGTPYGDPSSALLNGNIGDKEIIILSRHGHSHTIPPTQVNNRANLYALQKAGCTHIMATTACGSLREEIGRGDLVIPDQLIDFTHHRIHTFHYKGTLITIEGPRFSTKAESRMFRLWGADIINMSVATEAILANELDIPYAAIAMSTDYDSWKDDEVPVAWEDVLAVFSKNVDNVIQLLLEAIRLIV
jgi:5'-methylthioadenosine phosphorylase